MGSMVLVRKLVERVKKEDFSLEQSFLLPTCMERVLARPITDFVVSIYVHKAMRVDDLGSLIQSRSIVRRLQERYRVA